MSIAFKPVSNFGIQNLNSLNSTPAINKTFKGGIYDDFESNYDSFEFQEQVKTEPPKIGIFRILFQRLTKEQIDAVNKGGELPKNAKFVEDPVTGPRMTWNLCDFTPGTHKLPVGYELKRDILGFTHLVREGTKAWYLKKD